MSANYVAKFRHLLHNTSWWGLIIQYTAQNWSCQCYIENFNSECARNDVDGTAYPIRWTSLKPRSLRFFSIFLVFCKENVTVCSCKCTSVSKIAKLFRFSLSLQKLKTQIIHRRKTPPQIKSLISAVTTRDWIVCIYCKIFCTEKKVNRRKEKCQFLLQQSLV